jgi:hypothetical protein
MSKYILTLEDIKKYPEFREGGWLPGDEVIDGVPKRVYSDGSLSVPTGGITFTQEDIDSYSELSEAGLKEGDKFIDGEFVKATRLGKLKEFMLGFDEAGNDIEDWGTWLKANVGSFFDIEPGSLLIGEQPEWVKADYTSDEKMFGEGFDAASSDERRTMMINAKNRNLIQDYGYEVVTSPERSGTSLAGSLTKALATPTTLLPVGKGVKAAAAISGGLGAEAVIANQLATEGRLDPEKIAEVSALSAVSGGVLTALPKMYRAFSTNRSLEKAAAIVKRTEEVSSEGVAKNLKGKELTQYILNETKFTLDDIDAAVGMTGSKIRIPGSVQRAEEALKKTMQEEVTLLSAAGTELDKTLGILSTRIGNISQPVLRESRRFEFNIATDQYRLGEKVKPFLEGLKNLTATNKERFDTLALTGNFKEIENMLQAQAPTLLEPFKKVRSVYDELYTMSKEIGGRSFTKVEDYWHRQVIDPEGLRKAVGNRTDIKAALNKFEAMKQSSLSADEIGEVIDKTLRGFSVTGKRGAPGFTRKRTVDTITPDLLKYYAKPEASLKNYISKSVIDTHRRAFLGLGNVVEEGAGKLNADESIGNLVASEIKAGRLDPDKRADLTEMLKARHIGGDQSVGDFTGAVRDLLYAGTISNPAVAVRNLADLGTSSHMFGLRNVIAAAFDAKEVRQIDLGIQRAGIEFADQRLSSKALDFFNKYGLFNFFDRLGKEVSINAALKNARNLVKTEKGLQKFASKHKEFYGEEGFAKLVDELKSGKVTPDVKFHLFNEISGMQAISPLETPQRYQTSGNLKILYSLKTYMLKMYDVARRDIVQQYKKGNYVQATTNMAKLGTYLALANLGTGVIKDILLGREVDPDQIQDRALWELIGVFGFNRYTSDRFLKRGEFTDAAVEVIRPATNLLDSATTTAADVIRGEEVDPYQAVKSLPVVGPFLYNWVGGGAEKYNETYYED